MKVIVEEQYNWNEGDPLMSGTIPLCYACYCHTELFHKIPFLGFSNC